MKKIFSRTKTGQTGITLVEVVIATALLLLTFSALILSFLRMKEMSIASQCSLNAMDIARAEIESFRAVSYSNIVSFTNIVLTNTVLENLGGQKSCEVVENTNHYKEITLTIMWRLPGRSDTSSVSFNTLACD